MTPLSQVALLFSKGLSLNPTGPFSKLRNTILRQGRQVSLGGFPKLCPRYPAVFCWLYWEFEGFGLPGSLCVNWGHLKCPVWWKWILPFDEILLNTTLKKKLNNGQRWSMAWTVSFFFSSSSTCLSLVHCPTHDALASSGAALCTPVIFASIFCILSTSKRRGKTPASDQWRAVKWTQRHEGSQALNEAPRIWLYSIQRIGLERF